MKGLLLKDASDFPSQYVKRVDTGVFETGQVGVEYFSPDQKGGIYGSVYRQYFTTSLPGDLTSGSNVSKLIDFIINFNDTSNRSITHGHGGDGTNAVSITHSGLSGNGNLSFLTSGAWAIDNGWVDYTK